MKTPYVGRFAPSPTGKLHFGSLVAAAGSYLEARLHDGKWLVRMEDIDPPREEPGAADAIMKTMDAYGFEWDGERLFQSDRIDFYRSLLEKLEKEGKTYRCTCSRKEIREALRSPGIYPGTCRRGYNEEKGQWSWRIDTSGSGELAFQDPIQGLRKMALEKEGGDFIIWRTDGLVAYQLAVTADDGAQGVTHVVRGSDILDSTYRQIRLQQLLGLPTPHYLHLPVALGEDGQKLSKQNLAAPVSLKAPASTLCRVMAFLGHAPPPALEHAPVREFWQWAVENYERGRIPKKMGLPVRLW